MKYLDEFEKDILQTAESDEWKSKNNQEERLKELQSYIKNEKKKAGCVGRNGHSRFFARWNPIARS